MKVLSLFDGMSCGQLALERAGIPVDEYYACEIKKHAIKVTKENFPGTKHIGDVFFTNKEQLPEIDLLIGGSPCQDFSISNLERRGLVGSKSSLFFEYLRLKKELNPKWFLLENVKMKNDQKAMIDDFMGVEGVYVNSNAVSFQNRNRCYWTNIPFSIVGKYSSFQSIKGISNREPLSAYKANKTKSRIDMWGGKCPDVTNRDKINCLTCKQDRWGNAGLVEFDDFCRYLTVEECEIAQTVPVGYTNCLTRSQAYDVLGDGWTVDVIAQILSGIK